MTDYEKGQIEIQQHHLRIAQERLELDKGRSKSQVENCGDVSTGGKGLRGELHLQLLLDAAGESANRCRLVTMFLVIATILAFMAFWNSIDHSWVRTRQHKMANAVDFWSRTNDAEFAASKALIETKFFWSTNWYGTTNTNLAPVLQKRLEKLRDNIDELNDKDVRWVRVAFFGVGFDINDLGLFAGMAFSALLVSLGFFQKRELRSVKYFFRVIREQDVGPDGYELLAMRQVLTVPPVPGDRETSGNWEFLAGLPLVLPVIVMAAIVINDFLTLGQGHVWDDTRTIILVVTNLICLALVAVFTSLCVLYRRQITAQWVMAYGEFFSSSKSEPRS